jgi:hypothetical protein
MAAHKMQQLSSGRIGTLACPHVALLACRLKQSSRPVLCKGLPGFGSSGLPKATSNEWQVPSTLLPSRSPGSAEVGTLAGGLADSARVMSRSDVARDMRGTPTNCCGSIMTGTLPLLAPAGLSKQQHRRQRQQQQQYQQQQQQQKQKHCVYSAPDH